MSSETLRQAARAITAAPDALIRGTVKAVDGLVCTVETGDKGTWANILLRPDTTDSANGLLVTPQVYSEVAFIATNARTGSGYLVPGLVGAWEKIEILKEEAIVLRLLDDDQVQLEAEGAVSITAGDATFLMDVDGVITLNGGTNGPMTIIANLVQQLNALENFVSAWHTEYQAHVHPTSAPGAPTSTPTPPSAETPPTPTTQADLENPDVTH